MAVENYAAVPHPSKMQYSRAIQIVENDGLTSDQKSTRLQNLGFFFNGTKPLTETTFTNADSIINDTTLNDQQKINRLHKLGFSYQPAAQVPVTSVPTTTTTSTTATPSTGIPTWIWFAGGIAAIMLLKR